MKGWKTTLLLMLLLGWAQYTASQSTSYDMEEKQHTVKLFLAGDVMTGRGIDQALPHPVDPILYESYVKDARDYLSLAERANGEIKSPLSYDYIWGDAMDAWKTEDPVYKLINLETSITDHEEPWPGKGINYRMNPDNIAVLNTAGIDYVSLANNHVLDWKRTGLLETMKTLKAAGINLSGAGINSKEAAEPAVLPVDDARILVYSYGSPTSGIPAAWAAKKELSGVNFLPKFSKEMIIKIKDDIAENKRQGDLVIFSVHWHANWGYDIAEDTREFAHRLIDEAGVDLIFGHSSHHPLGLEVHNEKLIIYGAGDFFNDYEGISGHERYRGELALMYFPELDMQSGALKSLKMVPMEIKNFRLNHATKKDVEWLETVLIREGSKFGTEVIKDGMALWLEWD